MTEWSNDTSPEALRKALSLGDDRAALRLVDALVADVEKYADRVPEEIAAGVAEGLGESASWEQLLRVCETLRRNGQNSLAVRRWYARARIELDKPSLAIDELMAVLEDVDSEMKRLENGDPVAAVRRQAVLKREQMLARHLLGLGYQCLYLMAGPTRREPRRYDLEQALSHYLAAYRANESDAIHSGVRYIALETHRDRIQAANPLQQSEGAMRMAAEIQATLSPGGQDLRAASPSTLALTAELSVALGQHRRAGEVVDGLAARDGTTAADIGALLNALRYLWGLDESRPPGDRLLPGLRRRYEQLNRRLDIPTEEAVPGPGTAPAASDAGSLEAVVSGAEFVDARLFLSRIREQEGGLACIMGGGVPSASGFVIEGGELRPDLAGKLLVVTAAYAVAAGGAPPGSDWLGKGDTAVFTSLPGKPSVALTKDRVVFLSAERHIVAFEIEPPAEVKPLPIARTTPLPGTRVWLFGFPYGKDLKLAAGTMVQATQDEFASYDAESVPGMAGGPVLNEGLQVFALHSMRSRSGDPTNRVLSSGPLVRAAFSQHNQAPGDS